MSLVPTVTPPTFVLTPNDNSQWFPFGPTLKDIGEITFSVKAGNDAHVALGSAEDQPTGRDVPSHVEIFLGGWGNSRSGIRPATGDVDNQVEVGGAYLSRSDYNTFRITWSSTEIKLEHLSLCDRWITMVSMDRSSLDITIDRALVMTGWGSDGEFKLVVDDPSPCPPPPGTYLLACGSSDHWNGDCGGQTAAADTAERHEVRCCKDSVTKPEGGTWNQYAGRGAICANVWGESEDSSGTCQHALHYGEALAMCADLGGRLCTAEELLAECTRGSGCQHDRDMIWSSTEVVPTTQPTSPPSNAPTAVPTANPTTPQVSSTPILGYYVAGGSSANVHAGVAKEADPSELHKVRCCVDDSQRGGVTDLGTSGAGWNQHANCQTAGFDTWGESDPAGVCNPSMTYPEAVEVCSAVGARLCTKEELLADCARGTGCQFDKELNWSSSPVL